MFLEIKKMINRIKFYLILTLTLFIQSGCQSLKDGLEGNKRSKSAEEFLIEKKNPLVLPPDFSELPVPKKTEIEKEQNSFDLQKILTDQDNGEILESDDENNSLEKSIIEKIKNEE